VTPPELIAAARALVDEPSVGTRGWWSRGAALLTRQALESQVRIAISRKGADPEQLTFTVQLIVLAEVVPAPLARRAAATWSSLSAATHHHAAEIPASADELRGWLAVVEEMAAVAAD